MDSTRRDFVKKITASASAAPFFTFPFNSWLQSEDSNNKLNISIFSKHLQFLDYKTTGEMASEMGFSGVDLTVRPKGHVLPELVKTDLPKAINNIKTGGSSCKMITTSIESVDNPLDVDIIETAAKSGVEFYRSHWFKYQEGKTMDASLEFYQEEIKKLGELNKQNNIIGCYQNHAGTDVGSAFWEIKKILETADSNHFGTQYDIRHAIAEGGYSWQNGLKLLQPHIKVIVLKDFKWGKVNGKLKALNTPIGEGMVDFITYFRLLKKYGLQPPVSLHLEYPLGGAEKGLSKITVDKKVVFDAMKKDLNAVQTLWEQA
ncbi:sugar phosphate isomerase/epimerase family protein [Flagellimonas eckloniae]|uniref:Endonuclease n=1 Tax=Flagellimonas eckloniae TaxID=346185 RepID=A0A0Q1H8G0_9FLAO|nr:sugar phosphate isomerase/epimerase family protein [Allomuricauda eckloniae]KQC29964.1 endonuclease [Allomuricauda eckloniae]